jgi:hypothetical protein
MSSLAMLVSPSMAFLLLYFSYNSSKSEEHMEKKKTVGEISLELQNKAAETQDPIELQREMQSDYVDNLIEAAHNNKDNYDDVFYIVVLTKKEKLMQNVMRNYFFTRQSCPTPQYDQSVFMYNPKDEEITYLWTVPDKETCEIFRENALQVHERELLQCVLDFYDGTLDKLAEKLNNEVTGAQLLLH